MTQMTKAGAGDAATGQGLGSSLPGSSWLHAHCIPIALAVSKRGRWCTIAKVTRLLGTHEPVLAVVWRNQQGTREAISLPPAVLQFAKALGVRTFVLRDDRRMQMWRCPVDAFEKPPAWVGHDGERYLRLADLQPTAWQDWLYAERVVRLNQPPPEPVAAQQLCLALREVT